MVLEQFRLVLEQLGPENYNGARKTWIDEARIALVDTQASFIRHMCRRFRCDECLRKPQLDR